MNDRENKPYIQVGGARVGKNYWLSFNASIPFASLAVCGEYLELTVCGTKRYRLVAEEVEKLQFFTGLLSLGLQIVHSNPGCPRLMVVWIARANRDKLTKVLRHYGYTVE